MYKISFVLSIFFGRSVMINSDRQNLSFQLHQTIQNQNQNENSQIQTFLTKFDLSKCVRTPTAKLKSCAEENLQDGR
jgi:hypothetical protein